MLVVPVLLLVLFKFGGQLVADNEEYGISSAKKIETKIKRVTMDDEQWKKKLTPEQYRILRKAGTERPFGEIYKELRPRCGCLCMY